MTLIERAVELEATLRAMGQRSALVGGLAVSLRSRERFTRDIDFAVAVESDRDSETLARALQRQGLELEAVVEQEARGVVATLRLRDSTPERT